MSSALSPQDALVAVMIAISAADEDQTTEELLLIDRLIDALPPLRDTTATVSRWLTRSSAIFSPRRTASTP